MWPPVLQTGEMGLIPIRFAKICLYRLRWLDRWPFKPEDTDRRRVETPEFGIDGKINNIY